MNHDKGLTYWAGWHRVAGTKPYFYFPLISSQPGTGNTTGKFPRDLPHASGKIHFLVAVGFSSRSTTGQNQTQSTMVRYGRRDFVAAAISAAAAMALLMLPASLAEPVTSVESGIDGIRREFPAGLLEWSTECADDDVDYCSTLDFCESGWPMDDSYGYAIPGQECQPFNGPTILLKAGTKYKLTLRNTSTNTTTNLHTHGLHISGTGNSDDIRRKQGPGECLDYFWDIMDDHPGGTHWYHAHNHGESLKQVGGGAFGVMIVEDNYALNPDTPQWAKYDRVLQIFSKLHSGAVMGNGVIGPYVPYAHFPGFHDFEVERDRWFRLRVSVIDILGLNGRLRIDPRCKMMKVANDGIWSSTVPQSPMQSYVFSAASRIDFAVKCSIPGEFPLWYNDRQAARILVPRADATSPKFELEEWKPQRPHFLQGIMEADVPKRNKFKIDMYVNTINKFTYHEDYPLTTIAYGEVHEWTIHNHHLYDEIDEHPFHMHLYHMMVVSPGGCGEMHQEGEIYDTISGMNEDTDTCVVRFKAVDVGERGLVHCHNFPHSDFGAIGWINIVGRDMPINNTTSPAYECAWTGMPTKSPTPVPTVSPTTARPTQTPSEVPTGMPTKSPTPVPTVSPTTAPPTRTPTEAPTPHPTKTRRPTQSPTVSPTLPLCDMYVPPWERPPCVVPLPPCNYSIQPWRQPPCTPYGSPPLRPGSVLPWQEQFVKQPKLVQRSPGGRRMLRSEE